MTNLHLLTEILRDEKLVGTNYVDWKRKIRIVFAAERIDLCLKTPKLLIPLDASPAQKAELEQWERSNEMTKCYILASMSNILQSQHEYMKKTNDILLNLHEMFGEKNRVNL